LNGIVAAGQPPGPADGGNPAPIGRSWVAATSCRPTP